MENLDVALLLGILGAFFGSFATMLIWRLYYDEKGICFGRSKCPQCKKVLKPQNLVPVFSWVFQRGKCAFCAAHISFFYPVVELVFAFVFFVFTQKFFGTAEFLPFLIATFFALLLFFYDVRFFIVDRRISWPAIAFAVGFSFFRDLPFLDFLIGGAVGFLFYEIQYFVSKGRWVGAGDREFGAFMGFLLGWKFLLLALFMANILGVLFALPLLLTGKATGKTPLPMGAFLMPVLLIFLYDGQRILDFYFQMIGF
jgi:prepilin signal peptidase PulO-like enzyme (type II secretory pathway)